MCLLNKILLRTYIDTSLLINSKIPADSVSFIFTAQNGYQQVTNMVKYRRSLKLSQLFVSKETNPIFYQGVLRVTNHEENTQRQQYLYILKIANNSNNHIHNAIE